MPLKHATETLFVFLLGLVIVLTGFFVANLPLLPEGIWAWSLLFVLTLIYPLALSPLFRRDRADYSFRLLHWVPMAMLLLWFALQSLALYVPSVEPVVRFYTWGWTFSGVLIGFVLVLSFCLHVIRRRVPRTALLLAAFVPFTALGVMSEVGNNTWNEQITETLWSGGLYTMFQSGGVLMGLTGQGDLLHGLGDKGGSGEKIADNTNLQTSEDPMEEAWRERLRAIERRRERIEDRLAKLEEEDAMQSSVAMIEDVMQKDDTGTGAMREVRTKPAQLPDSGAGMGAFSLAMLASYCGVLHSRARKRLA